MAGQAASWASLYGHRRQKELVGQICFPFDGDKLDKDDREKLDHLIDGYNIALVGARVRLRFEGHCDRRGTDRYNRGLAQRRANAVEAYFDRRLKGSYMYFSSSALSHGERYAGRRDLELDRRGRSDVRGGRLDATAIDGPRAVRPPGIRRRGGRGH